MEYKLVIVVRTDLGISKGKMAAQVSHAAVNCSLQSKKSDSSNFSYAGNTGNRFFPIFTYPGNTGGGRAAPGVRLRGA